MTNYLTITTINNTPKLVAKVRRTGLGYQAEAFFDFNKAGAKAFAEFCAEYKCSSFTCSSAIDFPQDYGVTKKQMALFMEP